MSIFQNSPHANTSGEKLQSEDQDAWEAAYLRFETPDEEIRKFIARLIRLGASSWPMDTRIIELFCGRGNGLHALERLGFLNIEGVDLSAKLISQYRGEAKCHVADCRQLPFPASSKDVTIVQGGLHHLLNLPGDLDEVFGEIRRVLKLEGRVIFVEPWLTPFLRFVHLIVENPVCRRIYPKLDSLAIMIEYERRTYQQWLSQPERIRSLAQKHFVQLHESFNWGKWNFIGKPRF